METSFKLVDLKSPVCLWGLESTVEGLSVAEDSASNKLPVGCGGMELFSTVFSLIGSCDP